MKNRQLEAFTMVELMIAIAIIGILASVAVPYYGKFKKQVYISQYNAVMASLFRGQAAHFQREIVTKLDGGLRPYRQCLPMCSFPQDTLVSMIGAGSPKYLMTDLGHWAGCRELGLSGSINIRFRLVSSADTFEEFNAGVDPLTDPGYGCFDGQVNTSIRIGENITIFDWDKDGFTTIVSHPLYVTAEGELYRGKVRKFYDKDDFPN